MRREQPGDTGHIGGVTIEGEIWAKDRRGEEWGLGGREGSRWQALIVKTLCWAGSRSRGVSWFEHHTKGATLV